MKLSLFYTLLISAILTSCKPKVDFEIREFNPLSNLDTSSDTIDFSMDLSEAIVDGVSIPSKSQVASGYFKMQFEIINRSDKPKAYYYKVFYQNESYKFDESIGSGITLEYNKLSSKNFYGSWENAIDSFHRTAVIPNDGKFYLVTDSFKIIGNPRDENKYFGSLPSNSRISGENITGLINEIRNTPAWFKQIKEKAIKNNLKVEEQLYKDAMWMLNENAQEGNINNRWKRNPRVGDYSFLLALSSDDNLEKISEPIKNIAKMQGNIFINPYYELLYKSELLKNKSFTSTKAKYVLRTKVKFNPGSGIYINETSFQENKIDSSYYSENCGSSDKLFKQAQFEQYFHNINKNYELFNIPVSYDVVGDNYTRADYNNNKAKYASEKIKADYFKISNFPGRTVASIPEENKLTLKNPGNNTDELRKENVGLNTRIGFTYGKYIAKIKFPAIISKDNVWNGLTCAYWLKFQEEKEWNYRGVCESGYLSKAGDGPDAEKLKTTYYSEIDFEILKTSNYWPKTSYPSNSQIPQDNPNLNHDIIVTCTNWDLACKDPKNFGVGAKEFSHGKKQYTLHRWDDWYKALTTKTEINHDSIFNRPYYYEIDWQPDKITWRIGLDRNNMLEVAYMDNTVSSVPDNQMVVVFTQEFHDSKWWPLSPFLQELVPYPKNDIMGEILELQIE